MYKIFEGLDSVKVSKKKEDKEDLEKFRNKLGLDTQLEVISLSASIALFLEHNNILLINPNIGKTEKLANMNSFKKAELFDIILYENYEISEKRYDEFLKYYYIGFNIIKDWYRTKGSLLSNEVSRYCSLYDYVVNECKLDN